jgi:nucleotide-binding universal stress UspA family protein
MVHRILVPIDGSDTSWRGLEEAVRHAARQGSELLLLHVVDDFPTLRQIASSEDFDAQERERRRAGEALLTRGLQLARDSKVKAAPRVKIAVDSTPATILETAVAAGCELIVVGTHGHGGIRRAVLGSVADHLARHSPVPVLLVPPAAQPATADRGA